MSESPPQRRRLLYVGVGALAVAAAGAGLWVGNRQQAPASMQRDAAELLFALNLPDSNGKPFELASLESSPLIVNFWATWCAPCVEEMPELSQLHTELAPKGLRTVGLGIDSPDNIRAFAERLPVSYPLLMAGAGGSELARRMGNDVGGLPYTIVLDARKNVHARILGRFNLAALRAAVDRAMAGT